MHPTLDRLLALRDGEATTETSAHVALCPACAAEVERLRGTAAALRALPELRPPVDLWPAVRGAFEARQRRKRLEWIGGAALALAASLTLVVVAPRALRQVPGPSPIAGHRPAASAADAGEIESLVRRSQRLEATLNQYQPAGRVIDASSASAVAEIEDSIALIDARLSMSSTGRAPSRDVIGLWRDRVRLMDELVQVHDARPVYAGL
jgi:hypothetical protein